jgi:hypothetical protein
MQSIINESYSQRQRIFHLNTEHGCCDYSWKSARTGRRRLIRAVTKGVDCNGRCMNAALSIHDIDCSVAESIFYLYCYVLFVYVDRDDGQIDGQL